MFMAMLSGHVNRGLLRGRLWRLLLFFNTNLRLITHLTTLCVHTSTRSKLKCYILHIMW